MWGIPNAHLMKEHVHASGTHHALSSSMRRDDEMQPMSIKEQTHKDVRERARMQRSKKETRRSCQIRKSISIGRYHRNKRIKS